jgi:hypothetical protein
VEADRGKLTFKNIRFIPHMTSLTSKGYSRLPVGLGSPTVTLGCPDAIWLHGFGFRTLVYYAAQDILIMVDLWSPLNKPYHHGSFNTESVATWLRSGEWPLYDEDCEYCMCGPRPAGRYQHWRSGREACTRNSTLIRFFPSITRIARLFLTTNGFIYTLAGKGHRRNNLLPIYLWPRTY